MSRARELADQHKTLSVDGGTIKLDGNYPTGTNNVALGNTALDDGSLSGSNNTAIGHAALTANTTGASNVAVGANALDANISSNNNTAIGYNSLTNSTAADNTAIGWNSMNGNTTGTNNVAAGVYAMQFNTTGSSNVGIGREALKSNTTASNNTALGYQALTANTTGTGNVGVGTRALESVTTNSYNTAVGIDALENTTGEKNTAIGAFAGELITTGSKNTILGRFNGNNGGLDIRTSSNNIVLSDGDGNPRVFIDSTNRVGIGGTGLALSPSAMITMESSEPPLKMYRTVTNAAFTCIELRSNSGSTNRHVFSVLADGDVLNVNNSYGALSDASLKENVSAAASQWDDIKAVQVKNYSMIADNVDTANRLGVIAQDLEASGMTGLVKETEDGTKTVKYSVLYMKAVKALQEAMDRIETLEAKVATLEGAN